MLFSKHEKQAAPVRVLRIGPKKSIHILRGGKGDGTIFGAMREGWGAYGEPRKEASAGRLWRRIDRLGADSRVSGRVIGRVRNFGRLGDRPVKVRIMDVAQRPGMGAKRQQWVNDLKRELRKSMRQMPKEPGLGQRMMRAGNLYRVRGEPEKAVRLFRRAQQM